MALRLETSDIDPERLKRAGMLRPINKVQNSRALTVELIKQCMKLKSGVVVDM